MKEDRMEFFKLDTIDKKVLFHLLVSNEKAVRSFIDYLVNDYKRRRGVSLDADRILREIKESEL
jgi:hypothetical protein